MSVVPMPGRPALRQVDGEPPVSDACIAFLTDLLEQAKRGEITSIAAATLGPALKGGCPAMHSGWSIGEMDGFGSLLGSIACLQHDFVTAPNKA